MTDQELLPTTSDRLGGIGGIVTGGAQGIGAAIVRRLALAGATVRVFDLQKERAATLAEEFTDDRVTVEAVDLQDGRQIERALRQFADSNPLDFVVNNAGARSNRRLSALDADEVRRVFTVNVQAVEAMTWHAASLMRGQERHASDDSARGWIVNVASIDAFRASAEGLVPYAASKHACLAMTRAMAAALAPSGILVNAICPGPILTRGVREHMKASASGAIDVEAQWKDLASLSPLGRLARASEIAYAVEGLIGPGVGATTGAALVVDGGLLLRPAGNRLRSSSDAKEKRGRS